jgi:translation initiation factor 1
MLPWGPMSSKRDSSFRALETLRDKLPPGPRSVEPMPAIATPPARAVVRYERKHRGGKEVTLVEKLGLSADDLDRWCRELKQALGCGGTVEQDAIVLQGDQRKRMPALLEKRGVAKVTVS